MRACRYSLLALGFVLIIFPGVASALALPISSCVDTVSGGPFTCNLFEFDASGVNFTETPPKIQLPRHVSTGQVGFQEPDNVDIISEILDFTTDGTNYFVQLSSDVNESSLSFTGQALTESVTDPTVYAPNGPTGNIYNVFSETAPDPVPEPSSVLLMGSGLVGTIGWRLRQKRMA